MRHLKPTGCSAFVHHPEPTVDDVFGVKVLEYDEKTCITNYLADDGRWVQCDELVSDTCIACVFHAIS